jgi:lipoyl(octanoyl) transferase
MIQKLIPLWLGRTEYRSCWRLQQTLHELRSRDAAPDVLLLTEHEPTYTTGRRRGAEHLLLTPEQLRLRGIALVHSDRGGDITYHGPGQLVGYPIVRLTPAHGGVVGYLRRLELGLIEALASAGVSGQVRDGLTGVWTGHGKIASIGVRLSGSVTLHGFALNVDPDLGFFEGIVPCGIEGCTMVSMATELGRAVRVESMLEPVTAGVASRLHMEPGAEVPPDLLNLARREIARTAPVPGS